jgi:hypothetical protein
VVDRTMPLSGFQEALSAVERGEVVGKVVLVP